MKYKIHYDAIPSTYICGDVLDVGCGDGSNQRNSTNYSFIQSCNYLGIDIDDDVRVYTTERKFDTVLAIHVMEHIPLRDWHDVIKKMKSWVKEGGVLIIGTPFLQPAYVYKNFKGPENQRHIVFNIDRDMLNYYIGPCELFTYRGPYSDSIMAIWRNRL